MIPLRNNNFYTLELVKACQTNNFTSAHYLLQKGGNPNETFERRNSPLWISVKKNNEEMVELLVSYGGNMSPSNGDSMLNYACFHRYRKIVKLMLIPSILPNINDPTPENDRRTRENVKILESICPIQKLFFHSQQITINPDSTHYEVPPIMIACGRKNDIQILQYLLLAGADVNISTSKQLVFPGYSYSIYTPAGWTPLMETCRSCRLLAIVDKLLEYDANIHARNVNGETALMIACKHLSNRSEIMQIIKRLLDKGADVNAKSNQGLTPLMYVLNKIPQVLIFSTIRLLVNRGADVNETDKGGKTALMYVCMYQSLYYLTPKHQTNESFAKQRIIRQLLLAGSDVNATDNEGKTALMHTCIRDEDPEVILSLLKAGADPTIADHTGSTPLIHSNFTKHDQLVAFCSNPSYKRLNPLDKPPEEESRKKIKLVSAEEIIFESS